MRKVLLLVLTLIVALSGFSLVACNKDNKETEITVSVVEEVTIPVGEKHIPEITVSPEGTEIQVVVTDPDGASVSLGEDYSFVVNKFGEYLLKVSVNGEEKATCKINAVDGTAPVITKGVSDKDNVELGKYTNFTADLEEIEANDAVDGDSISMDVTSYKFADEKVINIENRSVVLNKVGVYTVYGYVMDMSGNKADFSYKINTVDTVKPVLNCKDVYYVWAVNGKATIPAVDVKDNGLTTVEATIKNSEGTAVAVKDGKFDATVGKYSVSFVANDGFNKSDAKTSVIRVMNAGVVYDFADVMDGDLWTGASLEANSVRLYSGEAGSAVAKATVSDWSDYGYLVLNVKNNTAGQSKITVTIKDDSAEKEVALLTIGDQYSGDVVVYFRESEVNAGSIEEIKFTFDAAYDLIINKVELKKLPEEIFTLPKTTDVTKTYDEYVLPEIEYISDVENFVKKAEVEIEGTKDYYIENGKYVFETPGTYTLIYKVTTKTSQVFTKKIALTVEKGEPILIIKNLPLGVVNEKAYISRIFVHNVDKNDIISEKVTYIAPDSTEEVVIDGTIADGLSFTPSKVGIYTVKAVVETKNGNLTATSKMYVKPVTETISYENNNGIYEGSTSQNDWLGKGEFSFNTNPDYVYSGLSSARYVIPSKAEVGTTYFLENMLKAHDIAVDTIQFALTAEKDGPVKIYLHCDGSEGGSYAGYSDWVYLKAGEWTIYTAPVRLFAYGGEQIAIPEGQFGGITGLAFVNEASWDNVFYIDQISLFKHEDLALVTLDADETLEAYEKIAVPHGNKLLPDAAYETYTEKLYNSSTKEEIDLNGKTEMYFTATGEYTFEVTYKAYGKETTISKKFTVTPSTKASLMVGELNTDMMATKQYMLPEFDYVVPQGYDDAAVTITATCGEEVITVDSSTLQFTPSIGGEWTINYKLTYGDLMKEVTYNCYIRSTDDLMTFENTADGVFGLDQGDANLGVSINTDMNFVKNGKQSLKIEYPANKFGDTTAFGSSTAFWLNQGIMRNDYGAIGYTEGKTLGSNAITFSVHSDKDCQVILDIPGCVNEWNYSYSKVYDIKAGWNELRFDNSCKLNNSGADYNFSEGIYKFFIGVYFADGKPTEDTVLYVDNVKLIYEEGSYELKPGEFLTFEKVGGVYQGTENLENSAGTTFEVSSDWAVQGNNSLKLTFDNSKLSETSLAGAKNRLVVFNSKWGGHIGAPEAHIGANALQLTVKPLSDMDILFDIEYHEGEANTWAYTSVYHLKANEQRVITIASFDTIQGGPILYDDGLFMMNINYLDFGITNTNEIETLYMDNVKFVNIPEYTAYKGEISSFERGSEGYYQSNQLSATSGATYELTDEWSSHGTSSVKVNFDKASFGKDANLNGHTWNRGIFSFGDAWGNKPALPQSFKDVKNVNAIAFDIYAENEMKAIFEVYYPNAANGWGSYTRTYTLKKGLNNVVIGLEDAQGATLDFTNGITQLTMNYVVETTDIEGTTSMYFDNFRYFRNKEITDKLNIMDIESVKGDYNGHADIKKGGTPTYMTIEPSNEWASQGEFSLKAIIDRSALDSGATTSAFGGTHRSIMFIGGWEANSMVPAGDVSSMNGIRMVIKAEYKQEIVFEPYTSKDGSIWAYSRIYTLQPGVNEIIITNEDLERGSLDSFKFSDGIKRLFINFLFNSEVDPVVTQTMYIDDMSYININ